MTRPGVAAFKHPTGGGRRRRPRRGREKLGAPRRVCRRHRRHRRALPPARRLSREAGLWHGAEGGWCGSRNNMQLFPPRSPLAAPPPRTHPRPTHAPSLTPTRVKLDDKLDEACDRKALFRSAITRLSSACNQSAQTCWSAQGVRASGPGQVGRGGPRRVREPVRARESGGSEGARRPRLPQAREHGSCLMPPTHMLAHHRGVRDDPHRSTRNANSHTEQHPELELSSAT